MTTENTRLDFDDDGNLLETENNAEILSFDSQLDNTTRNDVIQKLAHYRLVTMNDNMPRLGSFIKYINVLDGKIRAGGILIKDDEEFVALANNRNGFTWSVQKQNSIFFVRLDRENLDFYNDKIQSLLLKYRNKSGNVYGALTDDFQNVETETSISALASAISSSRPSLSKAFRNNKLRFKNYFLLRMASNDFQELRTEISLLTSQQINAIDIDPRVMSMINAYYPRS